VSGELNHQEVDVQAVVEGAATDSGVTAGAELLGFAESVQTDAADLEDRRRAVQAALGDVALVDAAAIVANFQRMVRIADGTGIPLDKPVAVLSADLRDTLNLDTFGSAQRTPRVGRMARLLGRLLRPLMVRRLRTSRQS
jgi:hypothetical protein